MTGVLLAVLSALLYGTGVAFEHRQAAASPASAAGRPRLVLLLLRQPLWLVGAACEAAGFAAHSAALSTGSLACVQMVLSGSLIASVGIGSRLQKRGLAARSWLAVLAVVLGVGGTVALLGPHAHDHGADSDGRLAVAAVVTALAAAPVVAAAFVARGRCRPFLLGCAAGLSDAFVAVITMAFAHVAGRGPGAMVTSWPTYALIVGGLASILVTQTAFQADRPLVTLPIISGVTPLASVAVGMVILGETADLGGMRCAAVVVCVAIAMFGLITLARASAGATPPHSATPRTGATPPTSATLRAGATPPTGSRASRRPSDVGATRPERAGRGVASAARVPASVPSWGIDEVHEADEAGGTDRSPPVFHRS
jgi:hypothetical protein